MANERLHLLAEHELLVGRDALGSVGDTDLRGGAGGLLGLAEKGTMKVKAPFYCVQMVSEDSGVMARFALMGERLDFIGWVNDGSWDYQPDEICEDDVRVWPKMEGR